MGLSDGWVDRVYLDLIEGGEFVNAVELVAVWATEVARVALCVEEFDYVGLIVHVYHAAEGALGAGELVVGAAEFTVFSLY